MSLLGRWVVAALLMDMAVGVIGTFLCLLFGWSPADPMLNLIKALGGK